MPVYFVGFQVIMLMNLHFFHCHLSFSNTTAFICVLTITPVWVRLNLSIIETVFSLCPPLPYNSHPPFPLFFFLPLFLTAAFHVTAVSRWTAPLTPNAKSGTEQHFELCLSIFFFFFLTPLRICDANICQCVDQFALFSASWWYPRISASPAKQFGPNKTAR